MTVHHIGDIFDFNELSLGQPILTSNGTYFTKIQHHNTPLCIESPVCSTKNGFIKNAKKMICDLMFDNSTIKFINWLEKLEEKCYDLIEQQSSMWFDDKLERDDIESAFTSPIKIYKSGKYYLLRSNIRLNNVTNLPGINFYNENRELISLEDITKDNQLVCILQLSGIKFTNKSFQLEIEIKQCLVISNEEIFDNFLITYNRNNKKELLTDTTETQSLEKLSNDIINDVSLMNKNIENENQIQTFSKNQHKESINKINEQAEILSENIDKITLDNAATNENDISSSVETDISIKNENNIIDKTTNFEKTENNENNIYIDLKAEPVSDPLSNPIPKEIRNNILKEFDIKDLIEDDNSSNSNDLMEVNLEPTNNNEIISLKKPNEVYYTIYLEARKKAKEAKREALLAYSKAKEIKKNYMLDDTIDDSDENDEMDVISDSSEYDLEV